MLPGRAREAAAEAITEQSYRGYVETLASDEFEGRGPGSAGERKTVQYLEQQFLELGLQPVSGGSFRQEVPLVEITAMPSASHLAFERDGRKLDLALGDDMVVGTRRVQPAVNVPASDVVFVGYGIVAPEYGWNDYAGLDMRGKTALILVNDPGFATRRSRAVQRQGDDLLRALDLQVRGSGPAGRGGRDHHPRDGAGGLSLAGGAERLDRAAVLRRAVGRQCRALRHRGLGHPGARQARSSRWRARTSARCSRRRSDAGSCPFRWTSRPPRASATPSATPRRPTSRPYLPGKERPDEYVIYMAHWDHFGRLLALSGDTIFNGAQDNATGVAAILTIAQGFRAQLSAPARSVVFVAVTAEESGLIGSEYYAAHPLVPLQKTAAVINVDSLYPLGRARDIQVIGFGASELEDRLAAAAARQKRVLSPDANPEAGYFYRSDQLNLAKKGVPSLYIKSGIDLIGQPPGTGQAMVDNYFANIYHKQADDYQPTWDVSGSIEDLKLLFEVGAGVAEDVSWPNWYEGNEFRAARDASAAARIAAP